MSELKDNEPLKQLLFEATAEVTEEIKEEPDETSLEVFQENFITNLSPIYSAIVNLLCILKIFKHSYNKSQLICGINLLTNTNK